MHNTIPEPFALAATDVLLAQNLPPNNKQKFFLRTLDRVLRISMNFAKENPDTLIIVLADHETGGLVIKDGTPDKTWFTEETRYHTPVNVPVYSYGMNSNEFNGKTIENTEVFDIMFRLMGFQK